MSKQLKTPQQVKAEFKAAGISIADWAVQNGYLPQTVYHLINGRVPKRGAGFRAAVQLNIVPGKLADIEQFYPAPAHDARRAAAATKKSGVQA